MPTGSLLRLRLIVAAKPLLLPLNLGPFLALLVTLGLTAMNPAPPPTFVAVLRHL